MTFNDLIPTELSGMNEDDLCEAIASDAATEVRAGRFIELRRYTALIPESMLTLPVLDTAIRETVAAAVALGEQRDEIVSSLLSNYPEYAEHIEAAVLLDDVFVTTRKATELAQQQLIGSLPADFGPLWRPGERRYQLTRRLGKGAQSLVFAAVDRAASVGGHAAMVAVKLIPCDRTATFDIARREAFASQSVRHATVARVLDVGQSEDGHCYIATEYVEGDTLERWIAKHGRSPGEIVRLLTPVAEALVVAHARGVTHRDLTPRNIIIDHDGRARLIDFGIASDPLAGAIPEGRGSLGFCAPEQHREAPSAPSLADVYGLAALIFWAISGQAPNGATADDAESNLADATWLGPSLCSGADPRLAAVLNRALRPRPEDRYETMAALAEDLRRWLGHEPIAWLHEHPAQRLSLAVQRAPRAAFLLAACTLALTTSGALLTGSVMNARNARLESDLAQTKLRADTVEGVELIAAGMKIVLSRLDPRKPSTAQIALLLTLREFSANSVFDDPLRTIANDKCLPMMKSRLAELDARGDETVLEALHISAALVAIACDDPAAGDVDALLDDADRRWSLAGLTDDPSFGNLLERVAETHASRR